MYVEELVILQKATALHAGQLICRNCCKNSSSLVLAYLINAKLHQHPTSRGHDLYTASLSRV